MWNFSSNASGTAIRGGAEKSNRPEYNRRLVLDLTAPLELASIQSCLLTYAQEKNRLRQAGQLLEEFDLLIGATALDRGQMLITNNIKHFTRFNGLRLEDWSKLPIQSY